MKASDKSELIQAKDAKNEAAKEESPTSWSSYYFDHNKSVKIVKTAVTVLCMASMGIFVEMVGPTMTDLMARVGANYEEFATALVARSVGFCTGAAVAGVLAQRFPLHVELFLAFACLLGGVGTAILPWCRTLWSLSLMLYLQGHGQAFINTLTDVLILATWGEKASPAVQTIHFGFGVGAFISPLLARPFLSEKNEIHELYTLNGSIPTGVKLNETSQLHLGQLQNNKSHIEVPYSVSAAVCLTVCLILLGFYIYGTKLRREVAASLDKKEKLEKTEKSEPLWAKIMKFFSPGSCTGGKVVYGAMFFALAFFFSVHAIGIERSYGRFIFSYAVLSHSFSPKSAALLNSVFWIGFTAGRALTSIFSPFCPEIVLITVQLIANIVCGVVLTFWADSNETILWVFCCVYGVFQSPLFPSMLAWSNLYVKVNGLAIAVLYFGVGTGAILYQWLTGYLFEYSTPQSLMYIVLANSLCVTLTFVLMLLVVRPHGKRFGYQTLH